VSARREKPSPCAGDRVSGEPFAALGNVVLTWDSSVVSIYTAPTGGTALEQFIKPFSGFNGTNLYVEGIAPGSNTLSWSYSGQADCVDTIRATVLKVDIIPESTNACIGTCSSIAFALTNSFVPNGVTWSIDPAGIGAGATIVPNGLSSSVVPGTVPGTYTIRAVSVDSMNCFDTSTLQVFQTYKLQFFDQPKRLLSSAPVSWDATLQSVCQSVSGSSSYSTMDSITYGFTIDASSNVTIHSSTAGSAITVTTVTPYDDGIAGGLTIEAQYIACCTGSSLRWVQTINTTHPLGGCTSPYNDPCPPDDSLPYYWTDAELPSYISPYP
jgi:hypothetical protein